VNVATFEAHAVDQVGHQAIRVIGPNRQRFVSSFQNMDGSHNEFCKFIESSREYSTTFIREIASILGGPSWKSVHPSPCIVVTLFLG
jgi:hypothetical protein